MANVKGSILVDDAHRHFVLCEREGEKEPGRPCASLLRDFHSVVVSQIRKRVHTMSTGAFDNTDMVP